MIRDAMYILDTDHMSLLQQADSEARRRVLARCQEAGSANVFTTVVSFHEQALGWNTYISHARRMEGVIDGYRRLDEMLAQYAHGNVLPFDETAAVEFQRLKKSNVQIGTMDLRIASIALAKVMTLVTRNAADFRRVPGLILADWSARR